MSANMGGWWLYACPDCAWDLLGVLTFRVVCAHCTTNWPKLERTQGNFQCFSLISAVLPFRWSHLEISCSLRTHTLSRGNLLCNVCFGKNSKPSLRTFPHCCEFNCWISHDMISTHCARLHENSTVPGRHLETEHRWLAVSSSPHSLASLSPSFSTLSVSVLQIVRAQLFSFCYETAERRKQEMASWNIDLEARLGCLCSLWAEYKRERERERGKKFRIGLCNASSISFSSETEWPPQNRVVSQLLVHFCAARVFRP